MTAKEIDKICMKFKYDGPTIRNAERKLKRGARRAKEECKVKKKLESVANHPNIYLVCVKHDDDGNEYLGRPHRSDTQRFLKRQAAHKARRADLAPKGNGYRKVFDYRWTLT